MESCRKCAEEERFIMTNLLDQHVRVSNISVADSTHRLSENVWNQNDMKCPTFFWHIASGRVLIELELHQPSKFTQIFFYCAKPIFFSFFYITRIWINKFRQSFNGNNITFSINQGWKTAWLMRNSIVAIFRVCNFVLPYMLLHAILQRNLFIV